MKILDFTMNKIDKTKAITSYKVKYGRKDQEHLVILEALTNIVQCSCMKFSSVAILYADALFRALRVMVQRQTLEPYWPIPGALSLSHFLFADDCLLIRHALA